MASWYLFILAVLSILFVSVSSERIKDKMYESIEGTAACFRRLNGTHQFGCTSHRSGNVGVIHIIENETDLDWLLKDAEAYPYMVLIHPKMFTQVVMHSLKKSDKVNGVILANNGSLDRTNSFSHEDTCPNRYSGLSHSNEQTCDDTAPWNIYGTGLMHIDWGFPMFHVGDENTISKLYECYQTHNAQNKDEQLSRSLCALEMNSFMLAAVDSETCIRRSSSITILNRIRFCDPLGDRNIWSTLYPRFKPEENNTVIVVAARLDGTSMFDGLVPGAMSPVTGIVTLLMTARLLASIAQTSSNLDNQHDNNVLFLLLNGESYDYIGSSRLRYDMDHDAFPNQLSGIFSPEQPPLLHMHNIKMFIELGQISSIGREENNVTTFYMHQHSPTSNNILVQPLLKDFEKYMNDYGSELGLKFKSLTPGKRLPPSSLQNFLVGNPNPMPGVILTDYDQKFSNRYYHSIMDDSAQLNYTYQNGSEPDSNSVQALVAKFSLTLAHSLYRLLNDTAVGDLLSPEPQLVDELFHCYLDTMDCRIFQAAAANKIKLDSKTASLYVGVNVWPNIITTLTGQTLALLVNQTENRTEENCHNEFLNRTYQYFWMNNVLDDSNSTGTCIKTTMNYSLAISPAFFEITDYHWASGDYSTWTESIWREFSVRMFLKPSRSHENLTFSLGVVVLSLSFLIVYFANSRSHILFGNALVTSGC